MKLESEYAPAYVNVTGKYTSGQDVPAEQPPQLHGTYAIAGNGKSRTMAYINQNGQTFVGSYSLAKEYELKARGYITGDFNVPLTGNEELYEVSSSDKELLNIALGRLSPLRVVTLESGLALIDITHIGSCNTDNDVNYRIDPRPHDTMHYHGHHGILCVVNQEGSVLIARDSTSARQQLHHMGYEDRYMPVPFSNGEKPYLGSKRLEDAIEQLHYVSIDTVDCVAPLPAKWRIANEAKQPASPGRGVV